LEIDFGRFRRVFRFPVELDADEAGSSCEQGMLEVILPKLKPPKAVTVQSRSE
jgi:HSP20 family molecular chaperone IbpA